MLRLPILMVFFMLVSSRMLAQPLNLHFHRVTPAQGLNMSGTTAICEDKYGYIWLGTVNGLNRYDGYGVKVFEHRFRDSSSLIPSAVRYIFCDSEGRLWVSFMDGLMEYDYARNAFRNYSTPEMHWVTNIIEARPKTLYIATSNGLGKLHTPTGALTWFDSLTTAGPGWPSQVWDMALYGDEIFMTTRTGISVFNLNTETHRQIALPPQVEAENIARIAISPKGEVWLGYRPNEKPLWKTDPQFKTWQRYDAFMRAPDGQLDRVHHLFYDRQGRLWVASWQQGVARYDPQTDHFRMSRIEPWMPGGIITAFTGRLYQDKRGLIWSESTRGAGYFDPDGGFFQTILPGNHSAATDQQLHRTGLVENGDGRYWMSSYNGLDLYDPKTGRSEHFGNMPNGPPCFHDNALLSIMLDRRGDLWAATFLGLNRLRAGSRNFEFLNEKNGLPAGFIYYSVFESSDGTIWTGDFTDAGH
ncbi:MAG: hypothetical protein JNK89_00675, partial [Saprospiraceae bacterium]|nr:hypothetical protein [Saprospiraceae bacterium]